MTKTLTKTLTFGAGLALGVGLLVAAAPSPDVVETPEPDAVVAETIESPEPVVEETPEAERIEEDDPRWDCRTMGNKTCGPEVVEAREPEPEPMKVDDPDVVETPRPMTVERETRTAPESDEPSSPRGLRPGDSWDGEFLVGDIIVCPDGWDVSIDTTPDGVVWAACM